MLTVVPDEEVLVITDSGPFTTLFATGEKLDVVTSFGSPFTTTLENYPIILPGIIINIAPPCTTDGSGDCEDDRPDTGMLYPRG